MTDHQAAYDPIHDWTQEGRLRLLAERGYEIRLLLDEAFSNFCDQDELAPFGFRGEDPVAQAVEFAIERFASARTIDPAQLHASSRSTRLFTEVRWWLAQKVGVRAYRRIAAQVRSRVRSEQGRDGSREVQAVSIGASIGDPEEVLTAFSQRLGEVLSSLRERTCIDLVGYWLEGTAELRTRWFGAQREYGRPGGGLSGKQRSFHRRSALFRFLCLFHDVLDDSEGLEYRAVALTLFSPCPNQPPYRVPDRSVTDRIEPDRRVGPRAVGTLRKRGCGRIFSSLVSRLKEETAGLRGHLEWTLGVHSLSRTTPHALGLNSKEFALEGDTLATLGRRISGASATSTARTGGIHD